MMRIPPRAAAAFTLTELVVALAIGFLACSLAFPVFTAITRESRNAMAASQAQVILQSNVLYAREYRQANAANAEPRVAGAAYMGTAVVFDQNTHKAWFCLNNQRAAPDVGSGGSGPYIELLADPDPNLNGPVNRKAYDRIRGNTLEHLDLPEHQWYYGVAVRQDASGNVTGYTLLGPRNPGDPAVPFAVCTQPTGESLPQRQHVYVDLLDGRGHVPVATAMPWVLVVPKESPATFDVSCLGAIPGATDCDKMNALIQQAKARLVCLVIGGAAKR